MKELPERIARALWDNRYPDYWREGVLWNLAQGDADAVIAALGLTEQRQFEELSLSMVRRYVTPWERIEEDA